MNGSSESFAGLASVIVRMEFGKSLGIAGGNQAFFLRQ